MAAWRPDDDDSEEWHAEYREYCERARQDRERRLDAVKRQLAEMGGADSPLFRALREAYAQSDPAFRARMEALATL